MTGVQTCALPIWDMRPLKEKISISIDSDLLEKLREKADEDCRPLSQYINLILRKYMEQKDKKQK